MQSVNMACSKLLLLIVNLLLISGSSAQGDINRTGCNRTVDAGDVLANPLLTGLNKGKPYSCWFLVSDLITYLVYRSIRSFFLFIVKKIQKDS